MRVCPGGVIPWLARICFVASALWVLLCGSAVAFALPPGSLSSSQSVGSLSGSVSETPEPEPSPTSEPSPVDPSTPPSTSSPSPSSVPSSGSCGTAETPCVVSLPVETEAWMLLTAGVLVLVSVASLVVAFAARGD